MQNETMIVAVASAIAVVALLIWLWARARRVRVDLTDDTAVPVSTLARVTPPSRAPPVAATTASIASDNLLQIKGIGPRVAGLLGTLGVTRFEQIAAWTDDDLARIDADLGSFAGRPARENWIEQARLLSGGDIAAFEAKYGKLDSGTR